MNTGNARLGRWAFILQARKKGVDDAIKSVKQWCHWSLCVLINLSSKYFGGSRHHASQTAEEQAFLWPPRGQWTQGQDREGGRCWGRDLPWQGLVVLTQVAKLGPVSEVLNLFKTRFLPPGSVAACPAHGSRGWALVFMEGVSSLL